MTEELVHRPADLTLILGFYKVSGKSQFLRLVFWHSCLCPPLNTHTHARTQTHKTHMCTPHTHTHIHTHICTLSTHTILHIHVHAHKTHTYAQTMHSYHTHHMSISHIHTHHTHAQTQVHTHTYHTYIVTHMHTLTTCAHTTHT